MADVAPAGKDDADRRHDKLTHKLTVQVLETIARLKMTSKLYEGVQPP